MKVTAAGVRTSLGFIANTCSAVLGAMTISMLPTSGAAASEAKLAAILKLPTGATVLNLNAGDLSFTRAFDTGYSANSLATNGSTLFVSRATGITAYDADFQELYHYSNPYGTIDALALSGGVVHAILNLPTGSTVLNLNAADLSYTDAFDLGYNANSLATDGSTLFVSRTTGITAYDADFRELYRYSNRYGTIDALALWSGLASTDAVPEPASWTIMLAGFGIVGVAIRRRRVAAA
ncbi:PEPxxWA-CTERM sorting domain-containing protein [Phenylobacterium sp.]|uniref:PEPxxWA-CTERM sorting domain-containing protein n=1 Tax=Phenylobacterium sp. TaxID=1871053 RepID=UPI0025E93D05|nr:PEPxxWA-CTERM sorting domain-containing protein [Phenylobacterium sp.]